MATNSLRHSGGPTHEIVVSVEVTPEWFRIGVLDSGCDGVIAARPPDPSTGAGFGLNLVRALSRRWGSPCAAPPGETAERD